MIRVPGVVVVVDFPSPVMIFLWGREGEVCVCGGGEGGVGKYFTPSLFCSFLFNGDQLHSTLLGQDRSTMGQRAETTMYLEQSVNRTRWL